MKIGILGSGDVAKALAEGFLQHGHEIKLGTRTPDKLADWAKKEFRRPTSPVYRKRQNLASWWCWPSKARQRLRSFELQAWAASLEKPSWT